MPAPPTWSTPARRNVKALPFRIQLRERDRTFAQLLATTLERGWWDGHALILTIDEIQTIEPAPRALLKVLHEGFHGCPVMVIGMGLQHAQEVLSAKAVGKDGDEYKGAISRFGLRLTLDVLSEDEAAEAVERGVESTGLGGGADGPRQANRRGGQGVPATPARLHPSGGGRPRGRAGSAVGKRPSADSFRRKAMPERTSTAPACSR